MKHSPGFLKVVDDAKLRVRETTVDEVRASQQKGEGVHLIDVREDHEWAAGRIPGATHMGRGILERDIENAIPDKDAGITLYCGGGYRSALAADMLQRMGYSRVKSMAGGIRAWKERNYPLTTE